MADKKISELPMLAKSSVTLTDILPVVSVGENYGLYFRDLFGGVPSSSVTKIVAADDTQNATSRADYECDGIADEVEINAALNALPAAGGTVFLLGGSYNLATQIIIPADNITIRGEGKSTKLNLAADIGGILINGFDFCVIEDLYIEGTGGAKSGDADGICLTDAEHCTVKSCWIKDVQHEGIWVLDGCSWILITGNWVSGSADNNIDVGTHGTSNYQIAIIGNHTELNRDDFGIKIACKAINCVIANNTVECAVAGGISIYWSSINPELEAYNNVIIGNVVYGGVAVEDGITIYHLWDANGGVWTVQGNTITDVPGHGIWIYDSLEGSVVGNVMSGCGDDAIVIENSNSIIVSGNMLRLNAAKGIFIDDSSVCVISNNNIVESATVGEHCIHVYVNSPKCVVSGNICVNAPATFDGIRIENDCDKCVISNNVCSGNQVGVHIVDNTCDRTIVLGNMLMDNTTAFTNVGTNTESAHNMVA